MSGVADLKMKIFSDFPGHTPTISARTERELKTALEDSVNNFLQNARVYYVLKVDAGIAIFYT